MSKNAPPFDSAAKTRIMRTETVKHGYIRPDSFATKVQSKVDKQALSPGTPTGPSVKRRK